MLWSVWLLGSAANMYTLATILDIANGPVALYLLIGPPRAETALYYSRIVRSLSYKRMDVNSLECLEGVM